MLRSIDAVSQRVKASEGCPNVGIISLRPRAVLSHSARGGPFNRAIAPRLQICSLLRIAGRRPDLVARCQMCRAAARPRTPVAPTIRVMVAPLQTATIPGEAGPAQALRG